MRAGPSIVLICVLVFLVRGCVVVASTVEPRIKRELPSRERNLREHKVAEALADAFVDALRTKAKYENGDVTRQQVTPRTPVKTKDFAYTNIRFKTYVDEGDTSSEQDNGFLQSLQESATREAKKDAQVEEEPLAKDIAPGGSSSSRDTASKEASSPPTEKKPSIEETLDAKLAAIEKEMDELKALKQEIASMKGNSGTADQKRRRLLDQGLPGWDPGVLYHKV